MRLHLRTFGICALVGLLACSVATAQYWTDFEDPPYTGTAPGTVLTGQGPGTGFYLPAGATSIDYLCYDYTGNALNIVDHPTGGGDQFVGGTGPAGATYARGQLDITFPDGLLTMWYDVAAKHDPAIAPGNNLGSWSIRPVPPALGTRSYIHLLCWQDLGNPALGYRASYMHYDALGVFGLAPGTSPGPEWENMVINHWYRCRTLINRDTNMFEEVAIIDLHSGASAVHKPVDWYLEGGSTSSFVPTAFRLFAGGGVIGNSTVWDNICIGAGIGPGDLNCDGAINFDDIDPFVAALSGPAAYYAQYPDCCHQNADANADGAVNFDDIDPFVALLGG